ncbi:hypothetical protein [Microvirga aerophila]|uniref:Anti-sigma factor NepR domain-containing protein n=1 Tax=Microvirga aerophila TaxID=670291 RepID=A0A512C0I6_9HYPH|nr:hypothetical protein [Microvirga aerophila]GEO17713.1 hypothetical protein MAE02_54090 [Microvirga aerophila]
MSHDAPSDVRLPHVDDLHPDVATFIMARAFAEVYRDVLEEPIPAPLVTVLRQMERWKAARGRHAA